MNLRDTVKVKRGDGYVSKGIGATVICSRKNYRATGIIKKIRKGEGTDPDKVDLEIAVILKKASGFHNIRKGQVITVSADQLNVSGRHDEDGKRNKDDDLDIDEALAFLDEK